jgi:hypothetical protein
MYQLINNFIQSAKEIDDNIFPFIANKKVWLIQFKCIDLQRKCGAKYIFRGRCPLIF